MTGSPEKLALHAAEALDLKSNPAFQRAVLDARQTAIIDLIGCDPTDVEKIRTCQARIRAIDDLCTELATAIIRNPRKPQAVA